MTSSVTNDDTKKQQRLHQWRLDAIRHLSNQGFGDVAHDLRNCECSYFVQVCHADISHAPAAVPVHCGLRICPVCEQRESYRKLLRYLPALQSLLTPNPDLPEHFLFKIVLTTPYGLNQLTSETFKEKQRLVNDFLSVYFYWYFKERGELSKEEIRSSRCNLKQHGIGALVSSEFGERGHKLHWHMLIYAPFMPHETIINVWRDVTGDECKIADVSGIYARDGGALVDSGDLLGAVQEIVKYATKFTSLKPRDVPQLYRVLRGNRRFRTLGILYGIDLPDDEEFENTCKECGAAHDILSVGKYLSRCQDKNVPPDDIVTVEVEKGVFLYFTREPEISSGKPEGNSKRARDALESDSS